MTRISIAEVRDRCAALSNEVSSLRQALDTLRKESATSSTTKPAAGKQSKRSYAKAVSTLRPSVSLSPANSSNTAPAPPAEAQHVQRAGYPRRSTKSGPKIKVDGARRIWNTMPTCSARAVATTIAKLFPAKLDLQVKRKTKRLANKTLWWFVVHGSEGDLTLLERDWENVQHQTLWSLQNYFMSPNKDDGREMHPPPLSLQEPTLPSAGSSSPSPSLLNQDHQAPSETSTPSILPGPQILSGPGSSSPGLGSPMHSSKPSTAANPVNGEESFLDNHQDPLALKT